MSLILDALKKLEHDRASRRKRSVRIASDILKGRDPPRGKRVWFWVGGLTGGAIAAVALALAYVIPFSPSTPVPEPVKAKTTLVAIPADPPAESVAALNGASAPPQEPPAMIGGRAVKSAPAGTALRSPPASVRKAPLRKVPDGPPVSDSVPPPSLTVSGILWAENSGSRRAVINDAIVREGGNIGGAKVVEIREDHVRVSHSGQIFDIYISEE